MFPQRINLIVLPTLSLLWRIIIPLKVLACMVVDLASLDPTPNIDRLAKEGQFANANQTLRTSVGENHYGEVSLKG